MIYIKSKKISLMLTIFTIVLLFNILFAPLVFIGDMGLLGGGLLISSLFPLFFYLDKVLMPKFIVGPALLIFLYHFFGYVAGPIFQHYYLQPESFILPGMVLAQKYAYLGLLAFLIVYFFSFNFAKKFISRYLTNFDLNNSGRIESYAILLIFASFLFILFGYFSETSRRIGGIGGADKSLIIQSLYFGFWYCQFVGFFFLGYLGVKKGKFWFLIGLFFCLIYFAYQVTEGSRGSIITMAFLYGTGAVWAGFSRLKIILFGSACIAMIIFLAGPVDLYRSKASLDDYSRGLVNRIYQLQNATLEFYSGEGTVTHALKPFVVAVTALTVDRIMTMTPTEKPFVGFDGMDALLNMYIPKFIKPSRADINDGHKISEDYGLRAGTKNTFFYVPTVGDGYRRFGGPGVLLLYGFIGIFFGLTLSLCWGCRESRVGLSMLVLLLMLSPGAWSFTFNYAIYFFFFFVPKYFLLFYFSSLVLRQIEKWPGLLKGAS